MAFDFTTAVEVRKREDGLLEKTGNYDFRTAIPYEERFSEIYTERASRGGEEAIVRTAIGRFGVERRVAGAPIAEKTPTQDWMLETLVGFTYLTGGLYPVVQGVRGIFDRTKGSEPIWKKAVEGILAPEETQMLYRRLPGTEDLPVWAQITAGISENVIAYGVAGIAKNFLKQKLLVKDIGRKLEDAASAWVKDKFLPAGPVAEESLKNSFKNEVIRRWTATEAAGGVSGTLGKIQPVKPISALQTYAQRKGLADLVYGEFRSLSRAGQAGFGTPKIGDTISFIGKKGQTLSGVIKEITGQRAIIDVAGKQVVAVLSQLVMPIKEKVKGTKVVDDQGNPKIVYSGHSNVALYGKFDPKKATAGGFFATEDPAIASSYAQGKMGVKEYFDKGSQYRLVGKGGKFNKKIWQVTLNEKQLAKLEEIKKYEDEYKEAIHPVSDMDRWIENNKQFDKDALRMFHRGGSKDLQSIFEFYEYSGYNIAYNTQAARILPGGEILEDRSVYIARRAKEEGKDPYKDDVAYEKYSKEYQELYDSGRDKTITERQQENRFEELLDALGIEWQSYDWAQPGVLPVYLNIKNPLDTSKPFPEDLMAALKEKAKFEKVKTDAQISDAHWTAEYPLRQWIKDIEGGYEYWSTQIPSKAIPIIKKFGFDGIKDTGGKGGGVKHPVWIAFDAEQIVGAFDKSIAKPEPVKVTPKPVEGKEGKYPIIKIGEYKVDKQTLEDYKNVVRRMMVASEKKLDTDKLERTRSVLHDTLVNEALEYYYEDHPEGGFDRDKIQSDIRDKIAHEVDFELTKPKPTEIKGKKGIFKLETETELDKTIGDQPYEGGGGYKNLKEYFEKVKGQTGEIVYMSPQEYLDKIPYQPPSKESAKVIKDAIKAGKKLPMPYLDYSGAGRVSQEGRNRAYIAQEMGIEEIPVLVVKKAGVTPKLVEVKPKTFVEKLVEIQEKFKKPLTKELKETKIAQEEIIKRLEESELEPKDKAKFIRAIKNVQTGKQLVKALPEIQERIGALEEIAEKKVLTKEITKFAEMKDVDPDYRDQINSILEQYDLKKRTAKTKAIRAKRTAFFDKQKQTGNLDFLPKDYFEDLGKKTLDEMTLDEVQALHDQIQILATVGATKDKLLSAKAEKDFQKAMSVILEKGYGKFGKTPKGDAGEGVLTTPRKTTMEDMKRQISAFAAAHRKVEFILRTLGVNEEIFELIQAGKNEKLIQLEEAYRDLQESFTLLEESYKDLTLKDLKIEGVPYPVTKEQAIGVALNAGNQGNRDRLLTKLTPEEIDLIVNSLSAKEKEFVARVFAILESFFPMITKTSKTLLGINPKKVEGDYFPIYADRELSKLAKYRDAERDLFEEIFEVTFVPKGFTNKRVGGQAPVDLNVFDVIFKHIDSVIHFNTMAIPVRDVQKITNDPRFVKMVTDLMGQEVYNQIPQWLKKIANPRTMRAKGALDKTSQVLRHNATTAILGHRIVTSLLQGGSITLTVKEIGAPAVWQGVAKFWSDREGMQDWVYSLSPSIKNRGTEMDREIRDWLKTKQALKITKGKKMWEEVLFEWIKAVDYLTIMPSWIAAYDVRFAETQNIDLSARYADMIVRVTQPQAAVENLSAIMSGTPTQKLLTSFMTFFSVAHNQFVASLDEFKYSKDDPMRKSKILARSLMWIWIVPAIIAGFIRGGFNLNPKKILQEVGAYPFAGMIIIRDLANAVFKGYDMGAPPALGGFKEIAFTTKTKNIGKKTIHGLKAIGILTGKIPTQYISLLDGFISLIKRETEDIRRLLFSEKTLKTKKKKVKLRRRSN